MGVKLSGKIAVISGGDSGIGLAISKRLKAENVKIYNISKNVSNNPIFEKSFECDISNDEDLKKIVNAILDAEKNIDLLFCNAGIGIGGRVENTSLEVVEKILNVNLLAQIKMTKLFLKNINRGGKIVYTGSLASIVPLPYQACYSVSKAGVESFSRALATELKSKKISVTTIMPGDIKTNFTDARIKQIGEDKAESHGIMKMEKAERKGKSPDFVAKKVLKIIKKKKSPLRVSIGFGGKFISFLVKFLPIRFVNFLVEKIYI